MDHDYMSFTGNLGRDPEMRFTPGGSQVTKFSVATNRVYKDSNGDEVKETTWRWVEAWGGLGEVCNKFLKKGMRVLVVGRLKPDKETGGPRIYQRKDGGDHTASFEVVAKSVIFLNKKEEEEKAEEDFPF